MATKEKEYKDTLGADPGNPIFADYADLLRQEARYNEGMEVCLAGLSLNPVCHKGRLVLARIYYERGFLPFAVNELLILNRKLPESVSVRKLLEKLAPDEQLSEAGSGQEAVVSETEFNFEQLDLIEKDEKENQ